MVSKIKSLYAYLATPWYYVRVLSPQHRSKEAWIAHQKARGLKGDGSKL